MSKQGVKLAIEYAKDLPKFENLSKAKKFFSEYRKDLLDYLKSISKHSEIFKMDFTLESLKTLEYWYFELYESDGFTKLGIKREDFEMAMGVYFGAIVKRNKKLAKWDVEEDVFMRGRYDLSIECDNHAITLIYLCSDNYKIPDNKRKQHLYRMYKHYYG